MSRRFQNCVLGFLTLIGLTGCSAFPTAERPAWRLQAENACLARGAVQETAYQTSAREIGGPGICGLTHPFRVTALAGGTVTLNSTQTLDCPMIEALDAWIKDVVQPAAQARFGEAVVRIDAMGSYSCRGINNMSGANLSEHAFANAIDIGGFVLASGRELNIRRGFTGPDEQESAFLHEAHGGACGVFTTVLGPGYNILHYNHFHVDLAMHGSTSRGMRRYCKPEPRTNLPQPPQHDALPDPPAIEEEMDIARAPTPESGIGSTASSFVASAPPPAPRAASYTPVARAAPQAPRAMPGGAAPRRLAVAPSPGVVSFAVEDPSATSPEPGFESPASEPAPRPRRPAEASPADWDVTSSVRP